jgi:hypothetical protein
LTSSLAHRKEDLMILLLTWSKSVKGGTDPMEVIFLEQSHSTGNSNLECLQSPPTAVQSPAHHIWQKWSQIVWNCLFLYYLGHSVFF